MKLTNKWSKFNIYLFVGVWSFSSRRKSRLGCLYHRHEGSYLRAQVSSSYNFLPHFSLSPLRLAFLAWRWFSRALAFRSLYYPWGKMGTTRSLKQLRLSGPQKVRDTGDPGQKKQPVFNLFILGPWISIKGLLGLNYFLRHLHFSSLLKLKIAGYFESRPEERQPRFSAPWTHRKGQEI